MMKKFILILSAMAATSAFSAPVSGSFEGVGVGMDLTTTKYKNNGQEGKQASGFNLILDYAMNYGEKFTGIIEGKYQLNNTKLVREAKLKKQFNLSYLQGYQLLPALLPYAKVNYSLSKTDHLGSLNGFGIGVGVKYAVSSNIEVGSEYQRRTLKGKGQNLKGNAFSANLIYRF